MTENMTEPQNPSGNPLLQSALDRMMLFAKPIQPKPIKTRSRAGCKYCRDKRKKCTEERPNCTRCIQFGVECVYEPIKKRKKRTTKFTMPSSLHPDATQGSANDGSPTHHMYAAMQNSNAAAQYQDQADGPDSVLSFPESWTMATDGSLSDSATTTSPSLFDMDDGSLCDSTYQLARISTDLSSSSCGMQAEVVSPIAWSPAMDDDAFQWSLLTEAMDWNDQMGNVPQAFGSAPVLPPDTTYMDHMPWTPSTSLMPANSLPVMIDQQHPQPQGLDRMELLDYFCRNVAVGLVQGSNKFVEEQVMPECYVSDAVRDAACALASAHLAHKDNLTNLDHTSFHDRTLGELAMLMEVRDTQALQHILVTLFLLLHYELLVQRGPLGLVNQHLQQAWQLLQLRSVREAPGVSDLEDAFQFLDVLHSLSTSAQLASPRQPRSSSESPYSTLSGQQHIPRAEAIGSSPLGLCSSLMSPLHHLAELTALKRELNHAKHTSHSSKSAILRTEYEAGRQAVEKSLSEWEPALPSGYTLVNRVVDGPDNAPEADVAKIRSMTSKAMACKQAALVHLHRGLGGLPSSHDKVQRHARAALWHCVAAASGPHALYVPPTAGAEGNNAAGLLWSLFVAACEAGEGRDRGLARQAFAALAGLSGAVNTGRAWEVVQEVWRRRDLGQPDEWRIVAEEMGVSLVFG